MRIRDKCISKPFRQACVVNFVPQHGLMSSKSEWNRRAIRLLYLRLNAFHAAPALQAFTLRFLLSGSFALSVSLFYEPPSTVTPSPPHCPCTACSLHLPKHNMDYAFPVPSAPGAASRTPNPTYWSVLTIQ